MSMNLGNTVRVAAKAIWTNKSRSILTMLGVIIGVGSVILLTSIGTGLQKYIEGQFEDLGSNTVVLTPMKVFGEGGAFSGGDAASFTAEQFDLRTIEEVRRIAGSSGTVLGEHERATKVSFQDKEKNGTALGTTVEYQQVRNTKAIKGRFFTQEEQEAGERVVVLGYKVADELFGKIDPVGKNVRIGSLTFKVVGVAEEKGGGFGGPSFDKYMFMPIETAFKAFDTRDVHAISVQVRSKEEIQPMVEKLKKYMLETKRRKEDEFDVFDQTEILKTINSILGVLTLGLGGIAAISLVVGGIGIMNIMLVSVTERTREIGLRKAIGATPMLILTQFLIESSLLSIVGGMIGVLLASALSLAIRELADFPSEITLGSIVLAFSVSLAVGVVFGVAPARKASKLSPIEALRSE